MRTKAKLVLLSGFLLLCVIAVSVSGYIANLASVYAAENITVVLNRSYNRVYNTSVSMQKLDNHVLAFLSRDASDGMRATEEFLNNTKQGVKDFVAFVNIMNENKIGDFDSPPEYRERILKLKEKAKKVENSLDKTFAKLEEDRYATFRAYLTYLRPYLYESVSDIAFLNQAQINLVIKLATEGASMTPLYISFGITVGALILGIALSLIISRYIDICINRQQYFMTEMSQGNFTFDIHEYNHDDFGMIIDKIRVMRDNLNQALSQVLNDMEKTQDSLSSVSQASLAIVQDSEDCQNKTLTVAAASEEMVSTTQDIAKNCEDASSFSNTTKHIIDQGVELVQNSINSIRQQSSLVQANSVSVEKVAKRSMDINAIVNTIEEIAAQTNLLALNAAIEAARAGEAGRGFAVVADEVRALASRTASSTQEIAKMVSDIQHDAAEASSMINDSVIAMESTTQETEAVEHLMHDIVEHVDSVNTQITQIASAAEEQTAASNEISTNIHVITDVSQTINNAAHSNDNIISQTVANLDELKRSLSVFKIKR